MNEKKLSELQKEYRIFFLEKMRLYGVESPAELTKEKKSQFFKEIKQDWRKQKLSKRQLSSPEGKTMEFANRESVKKSHGINTKEFEGLGHVGVQKSSEENSPSSYNQEIGWVSQQVHEPLSKRFTKEIIKSKPNCEQTDDLKILFKPNNNFLQEKSYQYPVVKMPKHYSSLKLPRIGRSNQKGYKENDFYRDLKHYMPDIEMTNNVHMVIPNFNKPFEPDIVLFDKSLNLYIDIEIDEPYDGYFRYPTHFISPEEDVKKDDIRDLFFIESGWIVLRFTEWQIHCQTNQCIDYIKNVFNSVCDRDFISEAKCDKENQWDYNQCIQWQKSRYREKYLGINGFQKQYSYKEIKIDSSESESIERVIERTEKISFDWVVDIAFDEASHKYFHPKDHTGNAEYTSVTTVIERFFPFDLKRYIERKASEEKRSEEDVLDEYLIVRDEAAEKGTHLHKQIENYLKQTQFESPSKEFNLFLDFYNNEIVKRNLIFYDAEKVIFSINYNVAGTIDCLFKKPNKDEFVIIDWKRSKKLIIDGRPRIFGYGYALSELSHLDNSSYYRYSLQQNIYKHILESEYSMKVSSMKLVVLHENYSDYYIVDVPILKKESNIILDSLKVKI